MSNTNYDVELNLSYSNSYRHYIPSYSVAFPPYYLTRGSNNHYCIAFFRGYVSFDDESETDINFKYNNYDDGYMPDPLWNDTPSPGSGTYIDPADVAGRSISKSGLASKIYFRNPNKGSVSFNSSNCRVRINYTAKVPFEIQFNSVGFAANQNASFKCSTIPKNTYREYEWASATVYYKKSEESSYSSAIGTISGSWSDVRVDTNISLEDNYTYDIYIRAVADDGSVANTPLGQFTTTDSAAIATCISPVGVFVQGEATFVWSHATSYGTPQHAYDLQYSLNNGSSWTTVKSHEVTQSGTTTVTLSEAGVYKWRVRTYNSNDVVGEWAEASFVNNVPANPPTNLSVNTKGRPTVSWASTSQTAYQIQFIQGNTVVYDSGAVYTSQTVHFVNQYFNDNRSCVVRLRTYNGLGEVSEWVETGYQQEEVDNVEFTISPIDDGGALITIIPNPIFVKYFLLRNNKVIAQISENYSDIYASGITNYSVVAVTSDDYSDIQTKGFRIIYPHAAIVLLNGQKILINKRVNQAYEIQTNNEADISQAVFMGDNYPTHYATNMRLKSFTVNCFDDQGICEDILGEVVFYADNFGNGGYCIVKNFTKTDNFIKNGQGIYANEISLLLEVTNYDDSIEYPL